MSEKKGKEEVIQVNPIVSSDGWQMSEFE